MTGDDRTEMIRHEQAKNRTQVKELANVRLTKMWLSEAAAGGGFWNARLPDHEWKLQEVSREPMSCLETDSELEMRWGTPDFLPEEAQVLNALDQILHKVEHRAKSMPSFHISTRTERQE